MSSDISDIADDFRLGRVVHESGRLTNAEISEYEEILVKEQSNLLARARLLGHFNRLDCSNKSRICGRYPAVIPNPLTLFMRETV